MYPEMASLTLTAHKLLFRFLLCSGYFWIPTMDKQQTTTMWEAGTRPLTANKSLLNFTLSMINLLSPNGLFIH